MNILEGLWLNLVCIAEFFTVPHSTLAARWDAEAADQFAWQKKYAIDRAGKLGLDVMPIAVEAEKCPTCDSRTNILIHYPIPDVGPDCFECFCRR